MRVQYQKCTSGSYCKLNPIENGVYIYVKVSYISNACAFFKVLRDGMYKLK